MAPLDVKANDLRELFLILHYIDKSELEAFRWYNCLAPVPEKPVLPACMNMAWPPHRMVVWNDEGEGCPTYEARPKP